MEDNTRPRTFVGIFKLNSGEFLAYYTTRKIRKAENFFLAWQGELHRNDKHFFLMDIREYTRTY